MKVFQKLLILSLVIFPVKFCFATIDCDLAKSSISNEVRSILIDIEFQSNSIHSNLDPLCNTNLLYQYWNGSEYAQEPLDYMSFYDPNGGGSVGSVVTRAKSVLFQYDSFTNSVTRSCEDILYQVSLITCSGSNNCNCAEYLDPIKESVESIKTDVADIYIAMEDIEGWAHSIYTFLSEDMQGNFENIFQYYNFMTNVFRTTTVSSDFPNFNNISYYLKVSPTGNPQLGTNSGRQGIFVSRNTVRDSTLSTVIKAMSLNIYGQLASLNNYHYTNFFTQASIYKSSVSNNVAFGTIHHDLANGFEAVTNQFSIFIESSAGASPVLGAYTSNDGSYHDYLTNYYIKVSSSSVSGSTPLTNWFNRIEMLLAALVFQEDDGPNTNNIPGSSSYDNLKSELNQNMTTINQQGQDYLNTVDTSGKSLLSMLREWNSAVSGVAKPSAFVIASIPIQASSTRSSSGGSGSSLDITLDTDNESLAGFIELVRGVTTLAWVALFLVLGYFLSIRIITLIGKLISFGYSVYSAVFGGG